MTTSTVTNIKLTLPLYLKRYACPEVMACAVHHIGQPPLGVCCGPISRVGILAAYCRTTLAPDSKPAARSPSDTAAALEVQTPGIFRTAVEAWELTALNRPDA